MSKFTDARTAMVDCQVRPNDVTRYAIIDAMLSVPREEFVPTIARPVAYCETEIALGDGRVMLEPRVVGKMLDAANARSDDMVLHLSCGLGYTTALLARMSEFVVAVDPNEDFAKSAAAKLADQEVVNTLIEHRPLIQGAPEHGAFDLIFIEGAPEHGAFDLIFIEGGVETVPDTLISQLADDGRIIALVLENGVGRCMVGIKSRNKIAWRRVFDATSAVLPGFEKKKAFEF